ncbi:hypothetical protein ACQPZX_32495 [Actinoplanes sp. CA-142083]|uniref:hypothetical protein n=1 Tax=Actinoplanes sp. CA-142083 TaxID=3239903 RepID=UPI003D93A045
MDLGHGDRWRLDPCQACPAQTLPVGEFDVLDRPGPASRYDPAAGYRTNQTTGLPECVHPARVQLPACLYASNHEPPPGPAGKRPEPPDDAAGLEAWFGAVIRAAPAELADAELAASTRFPRAEVLAAMRRALSAELVRGRLVRSSDAQRDPQNFRNAAESTGSIHS